METLTLQQLSERPDGLEWLYLYRREEFYPPAPESLYGDFRDAQEWAEWTRPSVELPPLE